MLAYEDQRDALSVRIEFLRQEMASCLNERGDVSSIYVAIETLRGQVFALAIKQHGNDFQAAVSDLDAAKERARTMGAIAASVQGRVGVTH